MSRSRRFEQRISIERAALQIVNSSDLASETPLAGLTAAAIENWARRIKDRCDPRTRARLQDTLVSIATETGLLSDNSRAVFSSSGIHNDQAIDSLLRALATQCGPQPSF
jgi:hypothetical protein